MNLLTQIKENIEKDFNQTFEILIQSIENLNQKLERTNFSLSCVSIIDLVKTKVHMSYALSQMQKMIELKKIYDSKLFDDEK